MSPSLATQKILLTLLLIALGFGIWLTQTRFRAAVLFEQSQRLQDAWIESPELLTPENWLAAGEDLYAAVLIDSSAEYYHRYGSLLDSERTLAGQDITAEQSQQILASVIEAHLLGIQQRPTNSIGWAYFARAKALAGEFDDTFDLALERVYTLGPWNREHQLLIARLALYFWPAMSQNARYYIANFLQLALSNPGNDAPILNLFRDNEFLPDQLCPLLYQPNLTEASQAACQLQ